MDTNELIRRAEQDVAGRAPSAAKMLERTRRVLLERGDIEGLERLLGLTERLEAPGDLADAIRQDLRFLRRRAEPFVPT